MRVVAFAALLALAGCAAPGEFPPPAVPGAAAVCLVSRYAVPDACHHPASRWVAACTRMDQSPRAIVLPLPQDYPGDEYAQLVQFELAHAQQDWPDPPEIRARLVRDALAH